MFLCEFLFGGFSSWALFRLYSRFGCYIFGGTKQIIGDSNFIMITGGSDGIGKEFAGYYW